MINEFYVCNACLMKCVSDNGDNYEIWVGDGLESFIVYKTFDISKIISYCLSNKIHLNNFSLMN